MITGESAASTASTVRQSKPEYVIYSFRREENSRSADIWQNMGASNDIHQAREKAKSLYHSSRYSRIELRKKFVSEETGAVLDIPVEIFGEAPDRAIRNIIVMLVMAMTCAMLALGLSIAIM